MGVPSKLLTTVAFLDQVLGVLLHCGPIIPQCEGPMGKRSGAHMVSTNTFVDFPKHIVSLLLGKASEERLG